MATKRVGRDPKKIALLVLLLVPMAVAGPASADTIQMSHQPPPSARAGADFEVSVFANSTCGDQAVEVQQESTNGQYYSYRGVSADVDTSCSLPRLDAGFWTTDQRWVGGAVTMTASSNSSWEFEGKVVIPGHEVAGTELRYRVSVYQSQTGACAEAGVRSPWSFQVCYQLPVVNSPAGPVSSTSCGWTEASQEYVVPISSGDPDPQPTPTKSPPRKGRK